jgi:Fe-S-cluster containining protein
MTEDCNCTQCQDACKRTPGWFKFGEPEKAAEFMGLTLKDFFDKHLVVNYYGHRGTKDVYTLTPVIIGHPAGGMAPFNPLGVCGFYKDGKCSIHSVKPFECRETIHYMSYEEAKVKNMEAKKTWDNPEAQKQIRQVLGRKPYLLKPTLKDLIDMDCL